MYTTISSQQALITNLSDIAQGSVFLVTGADGVTGKTSFAFRLAKTLHSMGHRVLFNDPEPASGDLLSQRYTEGEVAFVGGAFQAEWLETFDYVVIDGGTFYGAGGFSKAVDVANTPFTQLWFLTPLVIPMIDTVFDMEINSDRIMRGMRHIYGALGRRDFHVTFLNPALASGETSSMRALQATDWKVVRALESLLPGDPLIELRQLWRDEAALEVAATDPAAK